MEEHGTLAPRSGHRLVPIEDVIPPTIFFAIAFSLCTFRICVRFRYFSLGWDDRLIMVAMMCGIGIYILGMTAVAHGLGTHSYDLPEWEVSLLARLSLFKSEFYVWGTTSIKLSIAFMLLRIRRESKFWRHGLIALMIFLISFAVTSSVMDYTECHPVRALWDFSYPRSACHPTSFFRNWEIVGTAVFFTTDVILSLLPLLFIRHIQRPLREKIVVCLLMGLGLLCAAAVIPKEVNLWQYGEKGPDYTYAGTGVQMWSALEMYWGIIAACAPVLKSVFEATLKKLGVLGSADTTIRPRAKSSFVYTRTRTHTGVGVGASTKNYGDDWRSVKGQFGVSSRAFATRSADRSWIELDGNPAGQGSPEGSVNQTDFDSTKQLKTSEITKRVDVITEIEDV